MTSDYGQTITGLRSRLREIREHERARMERAIARRSEPVLAQLAELTVTQTVLGKRKLELAAARSFLNPIEASGKHKEATNGEIKLSAEELISSDRNG